MNREEFEAHARAEQGVVEVIRLTTEALSHIGLVTILVRNPDVPANGLLFSQETDVQNILEAVKRYSERPVPRLN